MMVAKSRLKMSYITKALELKSRFESAERKGEVLQERERIK